MINKDTASSIQELANIEIWTDGITTRLVHKFEGFTVYEKIDVLAITERYHAPYWQQLKDNLVPGDVQQALQSYIRQQINFN